MEIYELEAFLGEIKDDEKVGIMEKHHIVFRNRCISEKRCPESII